MVFECGLTWDIRRYVRQTTAIAVITQVREQRANEVCRELRWQIANNQWDGNELAKKVAKWLEVAKRDKYDKLRLVNPSVPT